MLSKKRLRQSHESSDSDSKLQECSVAHSSSHDPPAAGGASLVTDYEANQAGLHSDAGYFKSYEDLHLHYDMIRDYPRTQTYREAILKNYRHFYKKVVLDVGAGTGILSVFCAQAGARTVYAVEASGMADYARQVVKENGMEDRIVVLKGKVEDVDLPEKVDLIVSEWMGYCLLHESMLKSVLCARDRFLKKGGYLYPTSATLYAAPISDNDSAENWADGWNEVESLYKVKMNCLRSAAALTESDGRRIVVDTVKAESVVARAEAIYSIDLATALPDSLAAPIKADFVFRCFGHSRVRGLASWFTVTFPGGIVLSTSPYSEPTHWCQSLFYHEPIVVKQDTLLRGCMTLSYDELHPRFLTATVRVESDSGEVREGCYKME